MISTQSIRNYWKPITNKRKAGSSFEELAFLNLLLFYSKHYNFSNFAWKKRRYFGSYTIFIPLIEFRRSYTLAADSAITSMCACVYTRRGMVNLTNSSLG